MLDITKIKETIDMIIEKEGIDRSRLKDDGAIYYMNGNDGTEFDYCVNDRTCEFYVFWKNGNGAIKLFLKTDKAVVYVYPEENPFGGDYKKYEFVSPISIYELCCYLQGTFDDKDIYDKEIKDWKLTEVGRINTVEYESEE